jgi:hypothetical protein
MDHGEFEGWACESCVLARDVDLLGCSRGLLIRAGSMHLKNAP